MEESLGVLEGSFFNVWWLLKCDSELYTYDLCTL